MKRFILFILSSFLFACSAAVNPYQKEFSCPHPDPGKCVGIPQAYQESLKSEETKVGYQLYKEFEKEKRDQKDGNETSYYLRDFMLLSPAERQYVESLYDILSKLLKDPKTPIMTPPKIVRVLILPYQDFSGKNFYSARYVYVLVDEPKWILQNVLTLPAAEEIMEKSE
ncbi:MAG: TraV family lipoprotein [Candidatus Aenigmatarchaeota archaeon]